MCPLQHRGRGSPVSFKSGIEHLAQPVNDDLLVRLGKNARIEQIARSELNMTPLTPARTQYLTEGGK